MASSPLLCYNTTEAVRGMDTIDRSQNESFTEHILVCLSSSPSNAKIVHTAAKMAAAFGGNFTALYVQTPDADKMDDSDKSRLQSHIRLAEQLGANITTVYGEDVSYQIAEFARISGVTKIVIGRSRVNRRHFWSKPTLVEKLIAITPDLNIHIIPDAVGNSKYRLKSHQLLRHVIPYPKDILITLLILAAATIVGMAFYGLGFTESNIITVYILGVLLTSLFTRGYTCGVLGAFISVALFNFFLTEPRLTFHAYGSGYPVTFAVMLAASIITGTLASKLKDNAKLSAQAAYRTTILLDTNQLLQKGQDEKAIMTITAEQLVKLLDRSVVMYSSNGDELSEGRLFSSPSEEAREELLNDRERTTAQWAYRHKRRAGATTDTAGDAECLYLPIHSRDHVYGVVGICTDGRPPDSFENSILLSILAECALAMENNRNAKEKEIAAVLAKNEQLRADLLRAISHDLRTPLTSISGNAGNLLANYEKMDTAMRTQIFSDILDDSQWLISLVENLLSVTRIEEGRMNFNMSVQLMDEVIEEAMKHIHRNSGERIISVTCNEELLLARMDARLIMQVIINLVDNAVKYTPVGSTITVTAENIGDHVSVSVADNGNGIPDSEKQRVFEMFYTGTGKIADSRRSLGLGLPLCRSIIHAHGGDIAITDNVPNGCIVTFTIPSSEVNINE